MKKSSASSSPEQLGWAAGMSSSQVYIPPGLCLGLCPRKIEVRFSVESLCYCQVKGERSQMIRFYKMSLFNVWVPFLLTWICQTFEAKLINKYVSGKMSQDNSSTGSSFAGPNFQRTVPRRSVADEGSLNKSRRTNCPITTVRWNKYLDSSEN